MQDSETQFMDQHINKQSYRPNKPEQRASLQGQLMIPYTMIGSLSCSPESVAHPVPIDLPFRPDKNSHLKN
jgi:hypothetical protein